MNSVSLPVGEARSRPSPQPCANVPRALDRGGPLARHRRRASHHDDRPVPRSGRPRPLPLGRGLGHVAGRRHPDPRSDRAAARRAPPPSDLPPGGRGGARRRGTPRTQPAPTHRLPDHHDDRLQRIDVRPDDGCRGRRGRRVDGDCVGAHLPAGGLAGDVARARRRAAGRRGDLLQSRLRGQRDASGGG